VRILHVAPYYADAWAYGGIPRLVTTMATGLAARGHDVTVCTTDVADAASRAPLSPRARDGVEVRVFRNISNRLAYRWQFFTPIGLRRFLRDEAASFDVGHIHACHNLPSAFAGAAFDRMDVPYVVSPNGTALRIERRQAAKRVFDAVFERGLLPRARRVLAVTETERRQLRSAGVRDGQIRVVPNPVDVREFDGKADPVRFRRAWELGSDPVVLYLGKITPRKGVDVLVRSMAHVSIPRARVVVAGNEMQAGSAYHRAIHQTAENSRVIRVGLLRGIERFDALTAADVVVYPSRDEIFGLVPLEALLAGRPVVVADDSGCGEVVRQTGGGLCVRYGDENALAAAVNAILADADRWKAHARDAAARVRALYAASVVCAHLQALYEEVCA
jgi:glycosyltransferase involved in cell wall biosynthesis